MLTREQVEKILFCRFDCGNCEFLAKSRCEQRVIETALDLYERLESAEKQLDEALTMIKAMDKEGAE